MSDYLTSFFGLFLDTENQLLLMFASAFLSATLLPGNSEIVFTTFASQTLLAGEGSLFWLLATATLGNSLGSLTTYAMARLLPSPDFAKNPTKMTAWALRFVQKCGVWVLLFSWLPVVGDLFCGVAGWLRLSWVASFLLITLGKAIRYGVLGWSLYAVLG